MIRLHELNSVGVQWALFSIQQVINTPVSFLWTDVKPSFKTKLQTRFMAIKLDLLSLIVVKCFPVTSSNTLIVFTVLCYMCWQEIVFQKGFYLQEV